MLEGGKFAFTLDKEPYNQGGIEGYKQPCITPSIGIRGGFVRETMATLCVVGFFDNSGKTLGTLLL